MTAFKWLLQYRTSKKEKKKQRERACAFESGDCLTAELGFVRFTFVCASADGHFVMTSMTRRCFVDDERWLKELLNVVLSLHSCFNKDFFCPFTNILRIGDLCIQQKIDFVIFSTCLRHFAARKMLAYATNKPPRTRKQLDTHKMLNRCIFNRKDS